MRGSYSGGAVNALLESEVYVDYVAGISAGATCLVNYLARLPQRSRRCFIDVSTDPAFGGWKTAIKGKGIFDTHHMYYDMTQPGECWNWIMKGLRPTQRGGVWGCTTLSVAKMSISVQTRWTRYKS